MLHMLLLMNSPIFPGTSLHIICIWEVERTGAENQRAQINPRDAENVPDVPNMKWDLTGRRRGKVEGDPLFMKAIAVQHSLRRPTWRWIRLLHKHKKLMACKIGYRKKKDDESLPFPFSPFPFFPSLPIFTSLTLSPFPFKQIALSLGACQQK